MIVAPDDDKQPIDWGLIDSEIYDWVTDVSKINAIWENQDITQPAYPYLSLFRISGPTRVGSIDEIRTETNLAAPAGEENTLANYQPVQFTLSISAYLNQAAGAYDPGCNAVAILSKLQASLGQQSVIDRLSIAGLSSMQELPVTDTSVVINETYISRATMDVIMLTAAVMTEPTGILEKAELESTELGVNFIVDGS